MTRGSGAGDELLFRGTISRKWTSLLCLSSFCVGLIFTNRCTSCSFFLFLFFFAAPDILEFAWMIHQVSIALTFLHAGLLGPLSSSFFAYSFMPGSLFCLEF
ncbi:unnamed protein product [Triticum turgidum subsp. durum]|uniref:DUF4094 domain-containing protein n=1 Tax=Triticum turgidum subsp. durum TaxID=4567 RepID=A0A9R1A6K7_TRITD|nr:unnamed protein product [Triticum turgidum subsp. durum]